jgi:choline dehydrogenase-like flavoprotein
LSYEGLPIQVEVTPQARNSVLFEDRPACAGSSNCIPICPIQAKYDATVHLKRALNPSLDPKKTANSRAVQSRFGCVATQVLVDGSGNVCGLKYKRADTKQEETVTAKIYILAMHAVEVPKVLLYSTGRSSQGVANSSDLVGRYLMDHDVRIAWSLADEPLYQHRGPMSSSGIESLRDGEFRKYRSAFRIQLQNGGTRWSTGAPFTTLMDLLDQGVIGEDLRRRLAWNATRQLELDALLEPIPDPENRVTLSDVLDDFGLPRPKLTYRIGDYTRKGAEAFEAVARQVMRAMGAEDSDIHILPDFFGAGHVMGTHRMGDSPQNSVTDSFGRTHDHPNLFLTGCGLLPAISTVNPTLTITALALRTSDMIQREFSRY